MSRRTTRQVLSLLAGALLAGGCGKGTTGDEYGPGAGRESSFAGDAGGPSCGFDEHECDGRCVQDRPNEPEAGCRLGCGDPCPVPEGAVASCTSDGRCAFECEEPYRREGDRCVCEPRTCEEAEASCGEIDDGCGGTLECGSCGDGAMCIEGSCGCPQDEAEPNDTRARAYVLGEFPDRPRTTRTYDELNLHHEEDVDWYKLTVSDELDGTNPRVTVRLDEIPEGSDYDLAIWYVCNAGGDGSRCHAGADADTPMPGCVSEQDGSAAERVQIHASCASGDDSGVAIVQVTAREWAEDSCAPYTLEVDVD